MKRPLAKIPRRFRPWRSRKAQSPGAISSSLHRLPAPFDQVTGSSGINPVGQLIGVDVHTAGVIR